MYATLEKIQRKPSDYKLCLSCKVINWYENIECHNCKSSTFNTDETSVLNYINEDYEFYATEGYDETSIDNIEVEI